MIECFRPKTIFGFVALDKRFLLLCRIHAGADTFDPLCAKQAEFHSIRKKSLVDFPGSVIDRIGVHYIKFLILQPFHERLLVGFDDGGVERFDRLNGFGRLNGFWRWVARPPLLF